MSEIPSVRAVPVQMIRSPRFAVSYPDVRNIELIEPGARSAMEASWGRQGFDERQIEVFHLRDVIAVDECLVLNQEMQVIENVSDHYTIEEYQHAVEVTQRTRKEGKIPILDGINVMARRRAAGNYGHFLIEMLPMAGVARRIYGDQIRRYLLHRAEPPMLDANLRAFRLAGITPDRLVITGFREPVFCRELVIVRGLTVHGSYMSALAPEHADAWAESVYPSVGAERRLFVLRRPGWGRGRELENEQDIADRLQRRGYRVIEPGVMPLEEQIAAFRGVDHVVGTMGAAMTNIVFCRPGTRITMLAPAHFPDVFFWLIAGHRNLRYEEVRGPQRQVEGRQLWEGPFTIAEQDIRWIEQLYPAPSWSSLDVRRYRLVPL